MRGKHPWKQGEQVKDDATPKTIIRINGIIDKICQYEFYGMIIT